MVTAGNCKRKQAKNRKNQINLSVLFLKRQTILGIVVVETWFIYLKYHVSI